MRIDPDRFVRDLLEDCFADVSARQWRERAQVFRDARPRPGDYVGQTTVEQRREQWRRLMAIAAACEARAQLIEAGGGDVPELETFLLWEAA